MHGRLIKYKVRSNLSIETGNIRSKENESTD
jgi:hypothetical protein